MDNKSLNGGKSRTNKGSLIQSIKSFEECMVDMKSTVLVPTRLNDIDCETMAKSGIHKISSNNEDLFNVYNDLRKINKILYGDRNRLQDNKSKIKNRVDINGNSHNCNNSDDNGLSLSDNLLTRLEFHAKHMKLILDELCGTAQYITGVYKEDVQNMHMNYNHIEYNNNEIKHYYTSNQSKEPTNLI